MKHILTIARLNFDEFKNKETNLLLLAYYINKNIDDNLENCDKNNNDEIQDFSECKRNTIANIKNILREADIQIENMKKQLGFQKLTENLCPELKTKLERAKQSIIEKVKPCPK